MTDIKEGSGMEAANDNLPLRLLTTKQAATMLAVSVATLRELVRAGELAFIQKGRGSERQHMSFHPHDIEDYIKRSRTRLCLSTSPKTARITTTISSSQRFDFAAARQQLTDAKRNS